MVAETVVGIIVWIQETASGAQESASSGAWLSTWIPLIIFIATPALAIFTYSVQKIIDRRSELRKRKADQYLEYTDAWLTSNRRAVLRDTAKEEYGEGSSQFHQAFASWEEAHDAYQLALNDLFLIAADDVLRRVTAFHHYLAQHQVMSPEDKSKVKDLYVAMIKAMRRDSFKKTALSDKEVKQLLPFT